MVDERRTVVVVDGCAPNGLAETFDLVTVERTEATAFSAQSGDPTADDVSAGEVQADCVVCPADQVGEVLAEGTVPVVAVTTESAHAASALSEGATDVLRSDDPAEVAVARVRNAIARGRLPAVEEDLRAERSLLDDIFERVPIHLYVKDREARHVRVSHAYLQNPEEFPGKRDVDFADSPHTRASYADDRHVIETGEPIIDREEDLTTFERAGWSMEHYLEQYDSLDPPDVAEEWVLTSKVPRYDEDGTVVGLIGVTRDISERKQYQRELEAQNERLEEFASVLSHDLRNPLNVAKGSLELARKTEASAAHLARMDAALDRMADIITEMLTLAREGGTVTETRAVDLESVVTAAWETVVDDASATLDCETLPTVRADGSRLRRLLENLFRNCVDHGGADVAVRVEWVGEGDDESVEGFAVVDDGPGIAPEDRSRAFERGFSTAESGTGLGLDIVRKLAKSHGWTVSLSASERGGTRVTVGGVEVVDGSQSRSPRGGDSADVAS